MLGEKEERNRIAFDFCVKTKKNLPTAAFSYNDVCCGNTRCFNVAAFRCLEEIAEVCKYYEVK
ncbi:MAG: hypothetical protein SVN78_00235 [Deferribacterota bacterium]|nr:hypothetical protein [Deferribacterota bacterium]